MLASVADESLAWNRPSCVEVEEAAETAGQDCRNVRISLEVISSWLENRLPSLSTRLLQLDGFMQFHCCQLYLDRIAQAACELIGLDPSSRCISRPFMGLASLADGASVSERRTVEAEFPEC